MASWPTVLRIHCVHVNHVNFTTLFTLVRFTFNSAVT
jgi:hypothetical protein